ncbi:hypothetical protein ACOSQ2_019785 [Xanthoceras sorbifolium]
MVAGPEIQSMADSNSFNKEQMEMLQKIFQHTSHISAGVKPENGAADFSTGNLAQKGSFQHALSVNTEKSRPWIVDSGPSDHMTGDIKNFKTFNPCHGNLSVKIADGSLSKVTGTGSVVISKNVILHLYF